jgi:ribosomal protein S18 acetylase RimI-like enzyme
MTDPSCITIREVKPADTAILATFARQTFHDAFGHLIPAPDMRAYLDESFDPKHVAAEIDDPYTLFLLAEESGEPAGYAKLYWGSKDIEISGPNPIKLWRLYAAARQIGKGVGAVLMSECISIARSRGYKTLWLTVNIGNARAIAFYERFGFVITGKSGFLLGGIPQQDHVMELSVTP